MSELLIDFDAGASGDYPRVLALNEAAVPAVNSIDSATLELLHGEAQALIVARADSDLAGFMLVMNQHSRYDSINFQYFRSHFDEFLYVDRIVVDPAFRRLGIGNGLYRALIQSGDARLTCEVNVKPPNPASLAFHQRLGFQVVAEQDTEVGTKRVALMVKDPSDE